MMLVVQAPEEVQVAEVQIRVAVLNHFTALGIPMTVAAE